MTDACGRTIDYMRISVTDRCNLRCAYCMPKEGVEGIAHSEIMRYEEIMRVVNAGVSLGITKIRITGGEPLVRKGIISFVRMVAQAPGIERVALTTNGVLFFDMGTALKEAGLDAVNFSLDCTDADTFHRLTRVDAWDKVMQGIELALELGLMTKINCVPIKAYNEADWARLAGLAKDKPLDVRFIEMMPIGMGRDFPTVNNADVLTKLIGEYGEPTRSDEPHGSGPAEYFDFPGFMGSVGFISALSKAFCGSCNRVRLTADGVLKPCLCYDDGLPLKPLLRSGISDQMLEAAMADAIYGKPMRHSFCGDSVEISEQKKMVQIGG